MKMPLQFDRTKQQLRWNNGTRLSIPGAWVDKGTNPIGSTWAKTSRAAAVSVLIVVV